MKCLLRPQQLRSLKPANSRLEIITIIMLQLMNNILLQAPEYNPDGPSVVVSMYTITL